MQLISSNVKRRETKREGINHRTNVSRQIIGVEVYLIQLLTVAKLCWNHTRQAVVSEGIIHKVRERS